VRPTPYNTDSKNLLEHHPPQRQEQSRTDKKVVETPTDPDEPTSSAWDLSARVNYP
jgi:hypothetical protein